MSEITAVDSDSSDLRVTEHETLVSSEPLFSPGSELNSPLLQADVLASKIKTSHSADNSDAFLTAMSGHLTTAGLTEVFNTEMERSEHSFSKSDTLHNNTLRMDGLIRRSGLVFRRAASEATGGRRKWSPVIFASCCC